MRSIHRRIAAAAVAAVAATGLAACGGGSSGTAAAPGGPVTLTWWHNGTNDPLLSVWKKVAADYHTAHPNVTIDVVPIQNEQFTTKMPLALQSDTPPDVYFNQGGGRLSSQADSGRVADITDLASSYIGDLGKAVDGWQVDGKQLGVPTSGHVVGFWYRKDLFAKAGITTPPATLADLNAAVAALKAAGIAPIALGGKDRWPDAFYYNYFAVRECSADTLTNGLKTNDLADPCFTKAGQDVLDFIATNPFQDGFNGTPAQQGIGSSAGLLASGKAAMELQGTWDPSTMAGLSPDKAFQSQLGWFPFPSVPGGQGDPGAALGGGDGFSCTTKQAAACAEFLRYISSPEVQTQLVTSGAVVIPANAQAASAITDPLVKQVSDYQQKASLVQTYFDIALPTSAGEALDDAAADMFAGKGGPDAVTKAVAGAGR